MSSSDADRPIAAKDFAHCTRCGSTKTERGRVRWYQRWRTALSAKRPHRCFDCGRRFWAIPPPGWPKVGDQHRA